MAVQLNHTIVAARDPDASAGFLAEILGLPAPTHYEPFTVLEASNGASLDYLASDGPIHAQHYAFLVSDDEFGEIFGRIRARGVPYWADPHKARPGQVNDYDGGQGVYFEDPDGHLLEVITRPYGSGG